MKLATLIATSLAATSSIVSAKKTHGHHVRHPKDAKNDADRELMHHNKDALEALIRQWLGQYPDDGPKTCSAHDYEGVWAYISQGGGDNYNSMITCPPSMEGSCQFMDQAVNIQDCAGIGTITPDDMYLNEHGDCAFKAIELTLVNANNFTDCPNVMEASRQDEYLLLKFGDPLDNGAEPDLENPVYYNADSPRQALQINK